MRKRKPVPVRRRRREPVGSQPGTLKYWQARITATISAMEDGRLTATECNRRITAYKEALSTQLVLRTLELQGVPDDAMPHFEPVCGEDLRVAAEKVVTVKRGVAANGAPIDETTVVIHTTAVDDGEQEEEACEL